MNRAFARTVLLTFFAAGAALAQNSDLAFLLGVSGPSHTIRGGTISSSVGGAFQANYAAQLHETPAGQLYLELPLMLGGEFHSTVSGSVESHTDDLIFFTPGVRLRFTPQKRVSFYAAGGVGVGSVGVTSNFVGLGMISSTTDRNVTVAFGFGGGIDFRLTRLLSLRAEGRDFLTPSGTVASGGHNHAFFMVGIGFHF